jgi:hypothetical protein
MTVNQPPIGNPFIVILPLLLLLLRILTLALCICVCITSACFFDILLDFLFVLIKLPNHHHLSTGEKQHERHQYTPNSHSNQQCKCADRK